jgi:hypothetical protein
MFLLVYGKEFSAHDKNEQKGRRGHDQAFIKEGEGLSGYTIRDRGRAVSNNQKGKVVPS